MTTPANPAASDRSFANPYHSNVTFMFILGMLFALLPFSVFAQVSGDYRSKNTSSTWSTATDWETYNGSTWSTASSKPGSANSVYIQSGHTVTLTGNEACNDLHICTGTTANSSTLLGKIALGANTLSVNGKMRVYTGTVGTIPGASASSFGFSIYPFTSSSGGKVSVVGGSRNLTVSGEWSSSISTASTGTFPVEINITSGQTVTLNTAFKGTSIAVNSGTLDATGNKISADNGTAGQGDITIASGATIISTASTVFGRTTTPTRAGTFTLAAGGKLVLGNSAPKIDMNSIVINGTIEYNRANIQTLFANGGAPGDADVTTYVDLILSGTSAKTLALNTTVNGTLSMQGSASLVLGGFSLTYGASSTLEYASALGAQTTSSIEFPASGGPNSLKINNASGVALAASSSRTIPGTLTLTSGAFSIGANVLTLNGAISQTGGTLAGGATSDMIFGGSGASTGLPAVTLQNLTLNRANGISLAGNVTVGGTLTFTSGKLTTGANTLSVPVGGTISGASSSLYVVGNLKKSFNTGSGQSFTFPIGDSSNYLPVSLTSVNVGVAGELTPTFTATDHANIATSGIDAAKSVNRYWTLTTSGGFAGSGDATFNYLSGDVDGGATPANFLVKRYNGTSWSATTVSGTPTSTSITIAGATLAGDCAIGESSATPTPPSATAATATPATVGRNDTTLLTVTVAPGANPTSSGIAVTADLSSIGGSATQLFYDDNTHGDVTAGDNIFSYSATIAPATTLGSKSLGVGITDAQSRSGTSSIGLSVVGATRTWTGGSSIDDNWTSSANWNTPPATSGDSVVFAGSTRTTPSLDSSYTVTALTFGSGASSFALGATGGSTLTLNGGTGVTNNSANAQAVNIPIVMGSAQTFNATGTGTLTIGGTVDNGGNLLTGDGANNSAFTGVIAGGGGVTKTGAGTMTLSRGNSYGGATTVNAGTLAISGGSAIPDTSAVSLANASGVTLSVGGSETVGSLAGGGATGGTVALGANNLTVGGTTTYSGAVTGTGKLVKTGTGTLTLTNAGAIGSSFITRIENGTVDLNNGGAPISTLLGSGNKVELVGGTLKCSGNVQANIGITFGELDIYADSTLSINRNSTGQSSTSPTFGFPLDFKGNANLSFVYNDRITNGTTTFSAASHTLEGHAKLTLGAFGVTISGPIGESGGSYSLTKAGPGTLNLSAVNTYSGGTTNLAGIIGINANSTFGDGTGTLVLAGGDVLANNTRASAPISNPISLIAPGTNTVYGDSGTTTGRTLPLSGPLSGTDGTLRVGNKATTNNVFHLQLTGGGFTFARPIIVGDTNFDSALGSSSLEFFNDNTTAPQIFTGVISGSAAGSIVRDATNSGAGGTTVLSGANTFSGGLTIARGFIGFGTNSTSTNGPVGTGTLEIGNDPNVGVFAYGGARTVENTVFLNGVTNVQFNGTNDLTLSGLFRVGGVAKTLTINNTGVTTISGALTNAAPLTKAGAGTLVLSGANANTGNLTNASGTLLIHGSLNVASAVYVAGGTLGGTGVVNGPLTVDVGGTFAPGASIGTLNASNNVSLAGTTVVELDKGAVQTSDQVLGVATLTEGGALQISNLGSALAAGDSFPVFSAAAYTGAFSSVTPGPGAGLAWDTELLRTNGTLLVHANPVANDNDAEAQYGETISIPVFKLLADDTGEPGETLSVTAVGANASLGGGFVTYTAPYTGSSDIITYTLSDGRGGTATGNINVALTAGGSFNQLSAVTIAGGDVQLSYFGIPGTNYALEISHSLTATNWTPLQTNPASGTGAIIFTNTPSLYPTNDFYRTHYVP